MENKEFALSYFQKFQNVAIDESVIDSLCKCADIIKQTQNNRNKVFFIGNGASASIASHCALDFTKQAGIFSMNFSDAAFLTAYGNDYGYENWVVKALAKHSQKGDTVVLISSSGMSPNIIKGGLFAKENGLGVITFSGFNKDNNLQSIGDENLWVNSCSYNIIETTHMLWLMLICDLIIGKIEYPVDT